MGGVMQINSQKGYTITEFVVTSALIVFVISMITGYNKLARDIRIKQAIKSERLAIEYTLKNRINCTNVPITCTEGDFISVTAKTGEILIADADNTGPTNIGRWQVRMVCQAGNEIAVEIARTRNGTTFSKDPINKDQATGNPIYFDWQHADRFLTNKSGLCTEPTIPVQTFVVMEGNICTNLTTGNGNPPACVGVSSSPDCPCTAPDPPACPANTIESHIIDDSFGGVDDYYQAPTWGALWVHIYGRQKLRYCLNTN